MNTRSIKKKNLDQGVYDRIIEKIINVEFLPGQQLDINDLAEEFGVSRTPVVQAIKMLNLDNILEISRTGKVSIPDFTIKQIRDIYDVRLMMEKYAVGQLCTLNDRKSSLERLKTINSVCRKKLEAGEIVEYRKNDLALHNLLISLTNNQCLINSFMKVQNQFMLTNYLQGRHNILHQTQSIYEHEELLNYIEAGDRERAERIIECHINRAFLCVRGE